MTKTEKLFFIINIVVWIPYSLAIIVDPTLLAGLGVFDQTEWIEKVEVRAMYGGAQLAIGLFALMTMLKPSQHKETALLFYVLLFSGLALVRIGGLLVDGPGLAFSFANSGDPANYNSGALWFFEVPMMLLAGFLYRTSSKASAAEA